MTKRLPLLALLLLVPACAAQQTTATGFIAPTTPLVAAAEDPATLAYAAPAERLAGYRAVIIEEIAFRPGPAAPAIQDPAVLEALRLSYRAALSEAFARRGYQLVAAPLAEGRTMRLRAAITGYERANVALNVATSLLAAPVTAGGAASESELVDALTGERLVAQATHSNGTPFLGGPQNYYREHGHARAALARHARELAARLPMAATNWAVR